MTVEEAIRRAIEGGYTRGVYEGATEQEKKNLIGHLTHENIKNFALDSFFWQSLGKALGWSDWYYSYYVMSRHSRNYKCEIEAGKENCRYCGYWQSVDRFEDIPERLREEKNAWHVHPEDNPEYLHYWHRLVDCLAAGKTAEEFFAELN